MLRVLGAVLFLVGAAGSMAAIHGSFSRPRPIAALLGLAAPVAVLLALTGALLVFVPDFFG